MILSLSKNAIYVWANREQADPIAIVKSDTVFIEKAYITDTDILTLTEKLQALYGLLINVSITDIHLLQDFIDVLIEHEFLEESDYVKD